MAQELYDALLKAKKGTAEYDEWLRKYREKRHGKGDAPDAAAAKEILSKKPEEETAPKEPKKEEPASSSKRLSQDELLADPKYKDDKTYRQAVHIVTSNGSKEASKDVVFIVARRLEQKQKAKAEGSAAKEEPKKEEPKKEEPKKEEPKKEEPKKEEPKKEEPKKEEPKKGDSKNKELPYRKEYPSEYPKDAVIDKADILEAAKKVGIDIDSLDGVSYRAHTKLNEIPAWRGGGYSADTEVFVLGASTSLHFRQDFSEDKKPEGKLTLIGGQDHADMLKKENEIIKNNSFDEIKKLTGKPGASAFQISCDNRGEVKLYLYNSGGTAIPGTSGGLKIDVDDKGKILGITDKEKDTRSKEAQEKKDQRQRRDELGGFYVGGKRTTEAQYESAKAQISAMEDLGVDKDLLSSVMGFGNKEGKGRFNRTTAGYTEIGGNLGFAISNVDWRNNKWEPVVRDGKLRVREGYDKPKWVTPSEFNVMLKDASEKLSKAEEIDIAKAKKGSPEYDEWLRKYREKRGAKADPEAAKSVLHKKSKEDEIATKVSKMSIEEKRKELQSLVDSGKVKVYYDGSDDDMAGVVEFTKDDLGDDFDYTVALANSALKDADVFIEEEDRVKDGKYEAVMNYFELGGTKVFGKDFNFSESPSSQKAKQNEKDFRDHFGDAKADKILKRIDNKVKLAVLHDLTKDDYEGFEIVSLKNLGITSDEDKQALEKILSNLREKHDSRDSWKGFGSYYSFEIEGDKLNISYNEIV